MKTLRTVLTVFSFAVFSVARAQDDSAKISSPVFKISANYLTRLHYYGRTDSLKSSGFFPQAEIWIKSKFFLSAAPVFINNSIQHFEYAGSVATIGYQNSQKKLASSVYVSKPFYKESSALVQSALKAQAGASFSLLNKIANLNLGADAKWSDRMDYGATAGLDHLVRIQNKDNSVWVIDPSAYVYAGTQNFQRSFYRKKTPGLFLFPGSEELLTQDVRRFSVLAYEVMTSFIYAKSKWMLIATPSYILPQNLIKVDGRPDLSENADNIFYASLTAKYSF